MKGVLLIICLMIGSSMLAQTKLIAFKSHSGSSGEFYELLVKRDIDLMCHNLGMAPQRIVQSAELDTVIYINDSTSIMITSQVCRDLNRTMYSNNIWSAGSDTVYNDDVWNNENPEEIKKKLKKDFYFKNNIDSVVFIGFPEEEEIDPNKAAGGIKDENDELAPPISNHPTPGMGLPIAIISVFITAVFIGLISWRKEHFKNSSFDQFA
jgi:hypothetical protein